MKIGFSFGFDAAHRLMGYDGLCKNIHGHHWRVDIVVEGPVSLLTGMVMDFKVLKKHIKHIEDLYDHSLIMCDQDPQLVGITLVCPEQKFLILPTIPTAEFIAQDIKRRLELTLPQLETTNHRLVIDSVTVYESSNCWAQI